MKNYKLEEICSFITDGKHGDCQDEEGSIYYFLSAKDIRNGKILFENGRKIIKEDFIDTNRRTRFEVNDILITNTGASVGRFAIAKEDDRIKRTTFQKSVSLLKPRTNIVVPEYLYYYLIGRKKEIINLGGGSAQANLLLRDIRAYKVSLPPLPTQKKIANILSAYDDLIENNNQRIQLLEEMAAEIYKEWFVRFRFPAYESATFVDKEGKEVPHGTDGALPLDWGEKNLETVITLKRGYDLPSNKIIDGLYPIVASTSIKGFHNEYKVEPPCICTGRSGSLGTIQYINSRAWPLNTTLYVKDFQGNEALFVYYLLQTLNLQNYNSGAGVPTLNRNHISKLKVIKPNKLLQKKFTRYVKPKFDLINILREKNETLQQTRDLLLPRLISGKLSVENLALSTIEETSTVSS